MPAARGDAARDSLTGPAPGDAAPAVGMVRTRGVARAGRGAGRAGVQRTGVDTMSAGARRISNNGTRDIAQVTADKPHTEPIVDATFTSVCSAVLLSAFIMAAILAMGSHRPVPGYAIFGSGLFGAVFGSFLVGALHLAVTDSRRHKDGDH